MQKHIAVRVLVRRRAGIGDVSSPCMPLCFVDEHRVRLLCGRRMSWCKSVCANEVALFLGQGLGAPANDAKNEQLSSDWVLLSVSMSSRLIDEGFRFELTPPSGRSDVRQYHACTCGRAL